MDPDLLRLDMKAKQVEHVREVDRRRLEGEAHRACHLCGAENHEHAATCAQCGGTLPPIEPTKLGFGP